MELPIIIVNFKTYQSATGDQAVKLAKVCHKVAQKTKASLGIAVQGTDLYRVANSVSIPVLAQHIDPVQYGSHTGHVLPEAVKQAGASGTLLNHSECQLNTEVLAQAVDRAKQVGLKTVVCADTPDRAAQIAKLSPGMVAVEPPELIGGDVSVASARPEIIKNSVEKVHQIADLPVLCGAGVKTAEDVKKALELGSRGVLLASGVTKAAQPGQVLKDLIKALK